MNLPSRSYQCTLHHCVPTNYFNVLRTTLQAPCPAITSSPSKNARDLMALSYFYTAFTGDKLTLFSCWIWYSFYSDILTWFFAFSLLMFTIISAEFTMHLASLPLECPDTKQHNLPGTGGSYHLTPGGSVVTTTTAFSRINKLQTLPTQSLPVFRKIVPRASSDLCNEEAKCLLWGRYK